MEISPLEAGKILGGLKKLHGDLGKFVKSQSYSPGVGSKAACELAEKFGTEFLHAVQSKGGIQRENTADHVTALLKTLGEPIETVAPWTCVRAALEMSTLSSWFLEPNITVQERVARGFAHRFQGLVEQQKFSKCAGLDSQSVGRRIEKVEADAMALGFPKMVDGRGSRIGIGRLMPSKTDLIDEVFKKAETYRLLSALAHGHDWAIQAMSFRVVPDMKVEPAGDGVHLNVIEKAISPNALAYLGILAAEVLSRPIWFQAIYYGWDNRPLVDIFERNFDCMGASKQVRCWQS